MNNGETPSTTTIKVIVRHSATCKKDYPGRSQYYEDCNCRKHLYIYENGEDRTICANTRIWKTAEAFAREQWDLRDPVKRKLREIEEREAAKAAAEAAEAAAAQAAKTMTVLVATDRWLSAQKGVKKGTTTQHQQMVNRVRAWAEANGIEMVADVTANNLDEWRGKWDPDAEEPYNQMGLTTQRNFQNYLKSIFEYVVGLGSFLERSPAAGLKSIKAESEDAEPLSSSQFDFLMAVIEPFCAMQTGVLHNLAAELEAEYLLQRWAGLRIGDAVALPRTVSFRQGCVTRFS
ncbi:MAG: hypothetical protein ABSC76_17925 [Terracidiphilus sp.]|jgi:site-specific recombinase XerD